MPAFFLETQLLYLRLFGEDDVQNLFRIEGSAVVMAYIRKPVTDPSQSLNRIRQEALYAAENEGLGLFACFEKATDTYIGLVKIKHIDDTDDMAVAMRQLGKDSALRLQMGRAAYDHMRQKFNPKLFREQMMQILRGVPARDAHP